MTGRGRRRATVVLAAAAGALALTACGSSGSGPSMMGGASRQPMMDGFASMAQSVPPGYRMASLICSAPSHLPGTTVRVMLGDKGMTQMMPGSARLGSRMMLRAMPAEVPAGRVSFVVANLGWRTHELVVLPLAAGQRAGQRVPGSDGRIDETGSLGEASATCDAGAGDGISSGAVGWVTLRLPAGRYELVCNRRNHYADGMYQMLVVT